MLAAAIAWVGCAGAIESTILTNPSAGAGAEMAYAASVDGTLLALGTPGENAMAGAVYTIDCSTLPCSAPTRIAPADLVAGAVFGSAVTMSGGTLVATAPGPEPGAAYVFVGGAGGWSQQAKLTPSGGSTGERFGMSASLSGDRLAIGANLANGTAGAVYVFVRSGATWTQEARIAGADGVAGDTLGSSVALDGDTLLAGAPMKRVPGGTYANGVVYVFTRDASGWSQQAQLTASTVANGGLFGFAVALAGDRAVVGAPYAVGSQGVAFVFMRSAGVWSQQTQLASAAGAVGDEFGWTVAIGANDVLVGAPFAGQAKGAACGASYVFDGTSFAETGGASIEAPLVNELAGWWVAASGARWAVSAPGHVVGADDDAGAAYWFDPTITVFHSGFDASGACLGEEGDDRIL